MKHSPLFFLLFFAYNLLGQDTVSVRFNPIFNENSLELNKKYILENDTIIIEALKFYLSDVEFYQDGKLVSSFEKKHLLMDLENPGTLSIHHITNQNINGLKFNIGIDSLTNVSGVFGGDLDPTNGMYWAWQSGYINFKLEGKSARCPARNHRFQFHIGGYRAPFDALQQAVFELSDKKAVRIDIPIDELLQKTDISKQYEIMSPSLRAVEMSQRIVSIFKIVP